MMPDRSIDLGPLRDGLALLRAEVASFRRLLILLLITTASGITLGAWQLAALDFEVKHLAGVVAAGKATPTTTLNPKAN